jgi:hypothetical protein
MRVSHLALTAASAVLLAACAAPERRSSSAPSTLPPVVQQAIVHVEPEAMSPPAGLLERVSRLAPELDPGVLALALEARACALRNGEVGDDARLAVIDYSRPSTEKRLWVFDMAHDRVLFNEHVAHGSGTGDNLARRFSNEDGSHATSLGLFRTAETYQGGNGYSLRLDGLDAGFNDHARSRAIVMHGAWYANPELIRTQGRLGRSQGCPALREQVAKVVIDSLKQRQLLFAYAEDAAFLQRGRSFACDGRSAAQILAAARAGVITAGSVGRAVSAP